MNYYYQIFNIFDKLENDKESIELLVVFIKELKKQVGYELLPIIALIKVAEV